MTKILRSTLGQELGALTSFIFISICRVRQPLIETVNRDHHPGQLLLVTGEQTELIIMARLDGLYVRLWGKLELASQMLGRVLSNRTNQWGWLKLEFGDDETTDSTSTTVVLL